MEYMLVEAGTLVGDDGSSHLITSVFLVKQRRPSAESEDKKGSDGDLKREKRKHRLIYLKFVVISLKQDQSPWSHLSFLECRCQENGEMGLNSSEV
jgi:hypothetical protein